MRNEILINIEGNDYLEIKIYQQDGCMNYYYGKNEQRGVSISFTKIEYTKDERSSMRKSTPMDSCNFRTLALKNKRKSQKQIDYMYDYCLNNQDILFDLWKKGQRQEIVNMLYDVGQNYK